MDCLLGVPIAAAGLFAGWRLTSSIAGPYRRRLARAALAAFFLAPSYVGADPAPAFACLLRGAALILHHRAGGFVLIGHACVSMLVAAAALFALGAALLARRRGAPARLDPALAPRYCRIPHPGDHPRGQ